MNNDDNNNPINNNPNEQNPVNNLPENPDLSDQSQKQPVINDFMVRPARPMVPRNPNFENAKNDTQNMVVDSNKMDNSNSMPTPQPTVLVNKKSNKRLFIMLIILVLLVLLGVGGYLYLKKNNTKSSNVTTTTSTSMANMMNTWTGKGTSNKFSDAANWSMGVPVNGQMLEINVANISNPTNNSSSGSSTSSVVSNPTPTIDNDLSNLNVMELKIDGAAKVSSLSLTGNNLELSGDISVNPTSASGGLNVGLNLPVTLNKNSSISVGGTNILTISGSSSSVFTIGAYDLNVAVSNTSNLNFDMPISGTGNLVFAANSVNLSASALFDSVSSSFDGKVEVGNNDLVALGNSGATNAFGTSSITVDNGGSLELQSTTASYALSNPLFLNGSGVNNSSANALGSTTGALTGCISAGAGKCTAGLAVSLSGMVTLSANSQVGALFLPQAGAKITGNSVSYHFTNLMKNNFTVSTVANSQAVIN